MVSPQGNCENFVSTLWKEEAQGDLRQFYDDWVVVHKSNGTNHMFKRSRKGLFFSDVKHVVRMY